MAHPNDQAAADAWLRAGALRQELLRSAELPRMAAVPVRLEPGETPHAELVLDFADYYPQRVLYRLGGYLTPAQVGARDEFGWRDEQRVSVYLTDHRLLTMLDGTHWLSVWHTAMVRLDIYLEQWTVVQTGQDADPLRWQGLAAPWLAIALTYLAFGLDHLAHRPEFAILGPAALRPEDQR